MFPCKSKLGVDGFWAPSSLLSNLIIQTHCRDSAPPGGCQRSRTLPSSIHIYCAEAWLLVPSAWTGWGHFIHLNSRDTATQTSEEHRIPAAFNLSSAWAVLHQASYLSLWDSAFPSVIIITTMINSFLSGKITKSECSGIKQLHLKHETRIPRVLGFQTASYHDVTM